MPGQDLEARCNDHNSGLKARLPSLRGPAPAAPAWERARPLPHCSPGGGQGPAGGPVPAPSGRDPVGHPGGGRRGVGVRRRRHQFRGMPRHGGGRSPAVRGPSHPVQQCRNIGKRQRCRGGRRPLGPCAQRQPEVDDAHEQARHTPHDRERRWLQSSTFPPSPVCALAAGVRPCLTQRPKRASWG